jgi:hypothetical protein
MGILGDQFKEQQAALSGGFKQNQQSSGSVQGVSVPVSIMRNGSKLRLGIMLSADVLQSPQALDAALSELEQMFDLDVWQSNGGSQSGGFKSGGGYQNSNGGGYGNRGGYGGGFQKRW